MISLATSKYIQKYNKRFPFHLFKEQKVWSSSHIPLNVYTYQTWCNTSYDTYYYLDDEEKSFSTCTFHDEPTAPEWVCRNCLKIYKKAHPDESI